MDKRREIPKTVCFANLSPGEVRLEMMDSVAGVFSYFVEKGEAVIRATVTVNSGPRVAEGRSQVVDQFTNSGCEWLWMVDSDMTFAPDSLDRLLETAYSIDDALIVGGLCFGGRAERPMFPTVYELIEVDGLPMTKIVDNYPKDSIIKVGATGAAFMLVHKSVFGVMQKAFKTLPNGKENPYPWFVEASHEGRPFGEDIAFCLKAQACGIPVYVDTGVKTGHVKTWELCEERYDEQKALAGRNVIDVVRELDEAKAKLRALLPKAALTLPASP